MKRRNKKETNELAKSVFDELNSGKSYEQIALDHAICTSYVSKLITKHRESLLQQKEFDKSLCEFLEKESEKIDIIVFKGDISDKNLMVVTVINPELTNADDYDRELQNRIWKELRSGLKYGFAAKWFEFLKETNESAS